MSEFGKVQMEPYERIARVSLAAAHATTTRAFARVLCRHPVLERTGSMAHACSGRTALLSDAYPSVANDRTIFIIHRLRATLFQARMVLCVNPAKDDRSDEIDAMMGAAARRL